MAAVESGIKSQIISVIDYIKSFGREQSRQHKQRAVLRTFDVQSYKAWISVWKGRPKETTVQAKLSVQVYKSDCVSVNDRWI